MSRQLWKSSTKLVHPIERARYDDDPCVECNQFPRKLRVAVDIAFGKSHRKGIVRAFDKPLFLHTLPERCDSILRDRGIRLKLQ